MRRCLKITLILVIVLLLGKSTVVFAEEPVNPEYIEPSGALEIREPVLSDEEAPEIQAYSISEEYTESELFFELEQKVKDALLAGDTLIDITGMYIDKAQFNVQNLIYFSPYFSNGINLTCYYYSNGMYAEIVITNSMTIEETKAYFSAVDNKVNEILSLIPRGASQEQQALIVHDYLVYEYEYDYDNLLAGTLPQDSYRSGGLLMKETGVCQAYSYAYKYLMNRLGFECYVTNSSAINHAWNIINIDNSYYHVDCTWDDPVRDRLGLVGHGYFLVSDEAVQNARGSGSSTHSGWDLTNLVCDNQKYDNAYWENVNTQIIINGNYAYYLNGYEITKRDLSTQTVTTLKTIGRWYVWGSASSYWTTAFSGLFMYQNELYYNTSAEIRKISPDGQNDSLVYTPDTTNGYVYGSRKHGTELQYVIKQSPNVSADKQIAPIDFTTSEPDQPTDILLSQTEIQMEINDQVTLKYTLIPETAVSAVSWKSDNEEVAIVDENGVITALASGNAVITVTTENGLSAECVVMVAEPDIEKMAFSDVTESDWYYDSVLYVYQNKLMSGLTETIFGPDEKLTRSQFATILYRLDGAPEITYENKFSDVPSDTWFTDGVLWASRAGVVYGYNDGSFGTEDNITREQMAVMMFRYAQYKEYDISGRADISQYNDAGSVNEYAIEALQWAVSGGIITGKVGGYIDPQGNATRAECAAIIMRLMVKYS